tara:strand:+ start:12533 stop:13060 length:528 start_codon:yes stop_codon:yes gene_type:complete
MTLMHKKFRSYQVAVIALMVAATLLVAPKVYAFINEAISMAQEAATPYVKEGFEVREDDWSGEVEPGKPLLVKHQLFRGNEYWFWAGTSWPGSSVEVGIFDSNEKSIALETFENGHNAGVRALPQKTGTYFIRVKVEYDPKKAAQEERDAGFLPAADGVEGFEGTVDWGLIYGYR